mmetsp:Transcript_103037/g.307777  ORF Transcript_103037/g.307777 Transcript_103037/m.307777 type:complete len:248 (+) Transcript_103037:166-909(+)
MTRLTGHGISELQRSQRTPSAYAGAGGREYRAAMNVRQRGQIAASRTSLDAAPATSALPAGFSPGGALLSDSSAPARLEAADGTEVEHCEILRSGAELRTARRSLEPSPAPSSLALLGTTARALDELRSTQLMGLRRRVAEVRLISDGLRTLKSNVCPRSRLREQTWTPASVSSLIWKWRPSRAWGRRAHSMPGWTSATMTGSARGKRALRSGQSAQGEGIVLAGRWSSTLRATLVRFRTRMEASHA